MIGQVFGRLTVVSETEPYRDKNGRHKGRRFVCLCECGVTKINIQHKLKQGERKSCGCSQNTANPEVVERERLRRLEVKARKAFITANKKTKEQIKESAKISVSKRRIKLKEIAKPAISIGTKCCSKCSIEKSVFEFHLDIMKSGGRRTECKACKLTTKRALRNSDPLVRRKDSLYSAKSSKKRKKIDPIFRWRLSVRRRLAKFTRERRWTKIGSYNQSVGCTGPELRIHLESQFTEGMSWDNRGEWHVDHIIPLSSAHTLEDMLKLNHYTNLQPLWAKDNLEKSDRMPDAA